MLRTQIIYFLIIFNIISCAVNQHVLNPEYKNIKIKNKELLIVKVDSSDVSKEKLSVFGEDEPIKKYMSIFYESLETTIIEFSSFLEVSTNSIKNNLKKQELAIPTSDINEFRLPSSDEIIVELTGNIPDFVLFILKLEIISTWYDDPKLTQQPDPKEAVIQIIHYAFWDNHEGQLVSYGKTYSSGGSYFLEKGSFKRWTYYNAKVMVENSPFNK